MYINFPPLKIVKHHSIWKVVLRRINNLSLIDIRHKLRSISDDTEVSLLCVLLFDTHSNRIGVIVFLWVRDYRFGGVSQSKELSDTVAVTGSNKLGPPQHVTVPVKVRDRIFWLGLMGSYSTTPEVPSEYLFRRKCIFRSYGFKGSQQKLAGWLFY